MTAITHDQITDKIKSSALLVALHLGRYNPVKTDKTESIKVRSAHNIRADDNTLSVRKNTLPTADVLEKIEKLDNKLRSTFDKFCAPYARGVGLLPAAKFLDLRQALNPLLDERGILVKKLADDYGIYREAAKRLLNGTFKESDYPEVDNVVSRFHHKLDVFPIADPRDAKLNVLSDIADSINAAVTETFKEKAEGVVPYIREVLLDPLVKFSETLQNPEATFKDSLVGNLAEACERAETLNILEDDEIVNAIYIIRQQVSCYPPHQLRDSLGDRADSWRLANLVIEQLGGTPPLPKVAAPRKPRSKKAVALQPEPSAAGITAHEFVEGVFSCTDIETEEPSAVLAKLGW